MGAYYVGSRGRRFPGGAVEVGRDRGLPHGTGNRDRALRGIGPSWACILSWGPSAPGFSQSTVRTSGAGRHLVIALVVVVAVVLVSYALIADLRPGGGPRTTIVAKAGTVYSLSVGQFNAVTFLMRSSAVVNGTFGDVWPIILYLVNTSQFQTLVRTLNITGFEWTSGMLPGGISHNLDLTASSGP